MIGYEYLSKGLYAMARAYQVNAMSGHLGAAVLAGYFIADQHLEPKRRQLNKSLVEHLRLNAVRVEAQIPESCSCA